MKLFPPLSITVFILLIGTLSHADDLDVLKARFEKAKQDAIAPLEKVYRDQLLELKKKAMRDGNLDLANRVEDELTGKKEPAVIPLKLPIKKKGALTSNKRRERIHFETGAELGNPINQQIQIGGAFDDTGDEGLRVSISDPKTNRLIESKFTKKMEDQISLKGVTAPILIVEIFDEDTTSNGYTLNVTSSK